MAAEHFTKLDIPTLSDAEQAAIDSQCGCRGCVWFRGAIEAVVVHASQGGMSAPRLAMNLAAVVGTTLGQAADDDHASDFVDEVAAKMKPFAELANRAAQAADLRAATEGATRQ